MKTPTLFTIKKRVSKKTQNIPSIVFETYKKDVAETDLEKNITELLKKNTLSFVIINNKTKDQKKYSKTKNDTNYTIQTLKK